jgi:hypothetical protein
MQLIQFKNVTYTKNENKNYDNSTIKKIQRAVALAARFHSHRAHAWMLCVFAASASRLSTRL